MAKVRYPATFGETGVIIGWAIIAVLVFLGTVMACIHFKIDRLIGHWTIGLAFLPLVGIPTAVVLIRRRLRKKRVEQLGKILVRAGFRVDVEPARSARSAHYRRFDEVINQIHYFPNGVAGALLLAWEVEGTMDKPEGAMVFEHELLTGSGRSAETHERTVIVWPMGHPDVPVGWCEGSRISLTRRGRWLRRHFGAEEIAVPDLAQRLPGWSFFGSGELGRRLAEKPEALALLAQTPKGETWQIGGGYLAAVYPRWLKPAGLEAFLEHSAQVVRALR